MENNYKVNDLYQGGYSSLDPDKGHGINFTGYRMSPKDIGMSTDARTANVLQEVSAKLNMGVSTLELSQVSPQVFESIPKGHLKEVNRLAKLTGIDMTLHAPVIEPSGMTERGFQETSREGVERQMKLAMERAHELNPDKSSPVTFHSSVQIPGTKFKPIKGGEKTEELLFIVNRDTGAINSLKEEIRHYPSHNKELKPEIKKRLDSFNQEQRDIEINKMEKRNIPIYQEVSLKKGETKSPWENLKITNDSEWDNSLNQVFFNQERADEFLNKEFSKVPSIIEGLNSGKIERKNLLPEQERVLRNYDSAVNYLEDTHLQINNLFSKAYKYGDSDQKKE